MVAVMEISPRLVDSEELDEALAVRLQQTNLIAVGVAAAWILFTAVGTVWLSERTLSQYLSAAASDATTDAQAMSGIVDQNFHELAAMPRVLSNSGELRALAARYSARGQAFADLSRAERNKALRADADVSLVSARLTAIRNELDYDLVYVLDASGIRIASSDWDQPLSLLGERLDDREYFRAAIEERSGHMFAVARTTRNPVLFFSAPIEGESGAFGVVVVRQDSAHLGATLARGRHLMMIVDRAGVVVAASRGEMTLAHVGELSGPPPDAATQREVYAQDSMRTLDIARPSRRSHDAEWLFEGRPYLVSTANLMGTNYQLMVLSPLESVELIRPQHYLVGALVAGVGVLIVMVQSRRVEARERRRHTARVNAALNDRLIALNQEKDRYLGIAAHDLRNPLSSMRGLAELMLETPLEAEQSREFLDTIRRTSDEMLHLVNDLLDTAVIESGNLELRKQPQDVETLVRRRMRHLEPLAVRKQIVIAAETSAGAALIDAARFAQVIDNLVSNAIKFSPAGSTVRVDSCFHGDRFTFSVQDQGPGIPAAERGLLFRSFQKLSARPTAGEKSTGLGLAIVKKIVDAHGGSIAVDDAPGGGTRFTVTTPVAVAGA
jgi:signal transduction histidine kinase